jgi:(hydroxyamino)benzene mutase
MNASTMLSRQGHRLLQLGVALFLFTSFQGFAVPYFTAPNLGRSVHTLSAFSGVLLLTLGLLWPRLDLGRRNITDRVLVFDLFGPCHDSCILAGWRLGSRQLDHADGGRSCARQ